jgi:hypothetical protein
VERAGIPYETDRGQVDRKSLRKTVGTHLAMAGVDLRIAVKLSFRVRMLVIRITVEYRA